ncbi:hypothetical protein CANINC_003156 [Pichia inconspicua]|uniref:Peptidase A1 domain-containing protein n=1 Tax=Pichia inconspicua TaxID=52247 RepID=A0A4V4NFJ5_9ASCO|nr:hypothetical protein CANINC_003156 [[Candida] inconspicua]
MWNNLSNSLASFLIFSTLCHAIPVLENYNNSTLKSDSKTSTLSPRLATKTINSLITTDYESFLTTALPVINLFPRDGNVFDYVVQMGENEQQVGLRLDLVQGDIWVPASSEFPECTASPSYYRYTTIDQYTSFVVTESPIPAVVTVYTTEQETTLSSIVTETSYISNLVDPLYVQYCASIGVFDILSSSTGYFLDLATNAIVSFQNATKYFSHFVNSILVTGTWSMDSLTVSFENNTSTEIVEFFNVPFIYANFSNVGAGTLALGVSDADYGYNYNFISNFVANGIINSNSYSLALNAFNYTLPELILGGVNPSYIYSPEGGVDRFNNPDDRTGFMALLDFLPVHDETETIITTDGGHSNCIPSLAMFSWGVTSAATGQKLTFTPYYDDRIGTGIYPRAAVIDSRVKYNFIPYSTLVELAVELNAIYNVDSDRWVVDCSVGSSGTIDLDVGNYTINIPISNLLYPATFNNTNLVLTSGDAACYLAFLPDYNLGYSILGTPFIKNVYLAVDNENRQLAVSQLDSYVNYLDRYSGFDSSAVNDSDSDNDTHPHNHSSFGKMDIGKSNALTGTPAQLQGGFTTLGTIDKPLAYTITTTTLDGSSTVTTVITYSNLQDPTNTAKSSSDKFYAIESGTIPFARRYGTVSDVTLKIPHTVVFTDIQLQSTQAVISDGELITRTRNIIDEGHKTGSANTETQTNYGFSSLVSSISSATKAAGSNLQVPPIFSLHPKKAPNSLLCLLYGGSLITICMVLL